MGKVMLGTDTAAKIVEEDIKKYLIERTFNTNGYPPIDLFFVKKSADAEYLEPLLDYYGIDFKNFGKGNNYGLRIHYPKYLLEHSYDMSKVILNCGGASEDLPASQYNKVYIGRGIYFLPCKGEYGKKIIANEIKSDNLITLYDGITSLSGYSFESKLKITCSELDLPSSIGLIKNIKLNTNKIECLDTTINEFEKLMDFSWEFPDNGKGITVTCKNGTRTYTSIKDLL